VGHTSEGLTSMSGHYPELGPNFASLHAASYGSPSFRGSNSVLDFGSNR